MHLARQLLREITLGLGEIAARVGYDSEAAFNRAFSRVVVPRLERGAKPKASS